MVDITAVQLKLGDCWGFTTGLFTDKDGAGERTPLNAKNLVEDYESSDEEEFNDITYRKRYYAKFMCAHISFKINPYKFSHTTRTKICCFTRKMKKNISIKSIQSVYTHDSAQRAALIQLGLAFCCFASLFFCVFLIKWWFIFFALPALVLLILILRCAGKWGELQIIYGGRGNWDVIIPRNDIFEINSIITNAMIKYDV